MILTKQFLKEKEACREGYEFACENLLGLEHEAVINKLIETGHVNWANWFITRMMDYKQRVQYAVFAAEQVLDIFEKKYPEDKRPRLAIEAAKKCIEDPSEENKQAARKARAADAAAAAAAAAADAAYAAYADAADAAAAAADAAYAAYAAAAAAAAADAAYAAYADAADAARKEMQIKILQYGISLLKEPVAV